VVLPGQCFSPTRWHWIDRNNDSQVDERGDSLRTVPTIVSAHTFCASRKTWFKRALGLALTQSTTQQIKAKFSYCDQIKFNEPILEPGTPK